MIYSFECPPRSPLPHFAAPAAQFVTLGEAEERKWGLRDLLTVKHTPAIISVVSRDTGALLWQNAASIGVFGEAMAWHRGDRFQQPHQPMLTPSIACLTPTTPPFHTQVATVSSTLRRGFSTLWLLLMT